MGHSTQQLDYIQDTNYNFYKRPSGGDSTRRNSPQCDAQVCDACAQPMWRYRDGCAHTGRRPKTKWNEGCFGEMIVSWLLLSQATELWMHLELQQAAVPLAATGSVKRRNREALISLRESVVVIDCGTMLPPGGDSVLWRYDDRWCCSIHPAGT